MRASQRNVTGAEGSAAPLTDSPWFWVMLFALCGLLATAAISGKYGRRQSGIERKYQTRERLGDSTPTAEPRRQFSERENTLIPLWPLTIVLAAAAATSAWMLFRSRRLSHGPTVPQSHGPPA